jgi:hypothetical protein
MHMSVTQRPQSTQLLVGLIRARRPRRTLDPSFTGMRPRGLRLQLNAALHSAALDRTLAGGIDPHALTGPRGRKRVADGLARALRSAQDPRPGITAAVRPDARELLGARTAITAAERRLRGPEAVTPQGVAMLSLLLTDGASALYLPKGPGELASQLRAAAAALALQTSQREGDAMERQRAALGISSP